MGVILFLLKTMGLTKDMEEVVFSSQLLRDAEVVH